MSRLLPLLLLLAGAACLGALAGCSDRSDIRVKLETHWAVGQNPRTLEIRAQVSGPTSDLLYKWFSENGECEPQQSSWPSTTFKFAEGTRQDRVRVEVWRGNRRVAMDEIEVRLTEARLQEIDTTRHEVAIEITKIPPSARGGENTREDIAGKVSGEISMDMRVVIYAQAGGVWYLQPTFKATHPILPDHTWSTWTHAGRHFAALIVRSGYSPVLILDALPPVEGEVLARTVVEGRKP